jgi:hypothetical protein
VLQAAAATRNGSPPLGRRPVLLFQQVRDPVVFISQSAEARSQPIEWSVSLADPAQPLGFFAPPSRIACLVHGLHLWPTHTPDPDEKQADDAALEDENLHRLLRDPVDRR